MEKKKKDFQIFNIYYIKLYIKIKFKKYKFIWNIR